MVGDPGSVNNLPSPMVKGSAGQEANRAGAGGAPSLVRLVAAEVVVEDGERTDPRFGKVVSPDE
jgi:hypothetical protein